MTYAIYLHEPPDRFSKPFVGTAKALYTGIAKSFPDTWQLNLRDFTELLEANSAPDVRVCFGKDQDGYPWIAPMAKGPDTTTFLKETE